MKRTGMQPRAYAQQAWRRGARARVATDQACRSLSHSNLFPLTCRQVARTDDASLFQPVQAALPMPVNMFPVVLLPGRH